GGGLAPAQLDHNGLAADGVGAAVQNIGDGNAAGQIAVNIDIVGVENVRDIHDGGNGDAALVDAAVHGDVRVAVDNAGHDEQAGSVNDSCVFRCFYGGADL